MAGYHHAKEPMVLTGEGSKFEKIASTPQEMDFVESRKFLRDSTNQQYHIPPEIMGILDNSNRSTIDSAFYLLNKNVLSDPLRMFERVMNTQLLWEDFDKERKLILHHENTVEEDMEMKLRIADEGLSRGTLTRNEWRIAMGYQPDERNGDVYLMSYATIEQQQNSNPVELPDLPNEDKPENEVTLPNNNENQNNNTSDSEDNEKELSQEEFNTVKTAYEKKYKMLKSAEDIERRKAIWKTFDARARSIEEPFKKSMVKAFTKQNELVNKTIKEAAENNKDIGTAIERLYNKEMDEALKHTLASAFITGLSVGAEHGQSLMGKKAIKEISEETRRFFNMWIDNYGLELAKDINNTTKKKLRKVLSEAIENGESLPKQVKKLIEVSDGMFDEDKKWRAELIARTESCTTMNAGSTALYQSEGIEQKGWVSVQDDRTRDAHLIMDGVVVPMGEKFEVPSTSQTDGAWMEYPGDPTAPAGQTCNCRCTIMPIVNV